MSYAHIVLAKKGPLARIWLAAHWEEKLTKSHVFETNIEESVEEIMPPEVKVALRTSGHLLLGVKRIHSRKAKYLLDDCNEAFVKMKMAFRPGMVDLPEGHREAAVNAITLPEVFHDFDTALPELNDVNIEAEFAITQTLAQEFTMREYYGSTRLSIDEEAFGEARIDENFFTEFLEIDEPKEPVPGTSRAMLSDDFGPPLEEEGFGEEFGQLAAGLFEGDIFGEAPPETSDDDIGAPSPAPSSAESRPRKQKRKLIVDEVKTILGEEMKSLVANTSDMVTTLDLAPPTKRLMNWKETGRVIKLFASCSRDIPARCLFPNYQRHLLSRNLGVEDFSVLGPSDVLALDLIQEQEAPANAAKKTRKRKLPVAEVPEPEPIRKAEPSRVSAISVDMGSQRVDESVMPPPEAPSFELLLLPPPGVAINAGMDITELPGDQASSAASSSASSSASSASSSSITEDETVEQFEKGVNKRAAKLFVAIRNRMEGKEDATLSELAHQNRRKQAAQKFYSLLELKKVGAIELSQEEPYGDIRIRKGPMFDNPKLKN